MFNENVSINTADSASRWWARPTCPTRRRSPAHVQLFRDDPHGHVTFASPFATDKYLINIPAADVTDSLGTQLAGEWSNGSSSYPSGNGTAPGTFDFQFNILHGDVNQDGAVSGADGNTVRLKLLQDVNTSGYSPFYDVAGTGWITGADGSYMRINTRTHSRPTIRRHPATFWAAKGAATSRPMAPCLAESLQAPAARSASRSEAQRRPLSARSRLVQCSSAFSPAIRSSCNPAVRRAEEFTRFHIGESSCRDVRAGVRRCATGDAEPAIISDPTKRT